MYIFENKLYLHQYNLTCFWLPLLLPRKSADCWGGFGDVKSRIFNMKEHSVVSEVLSHLLPYKAKKNSMGNLKSLKSIGNDLEVAAHISIVTASHINGFCGIEG